MTSSKPIPELSGEARLAAKRRSFWRYFAAATLLAGLGGGLLGSGVALRELAGLSAWAIAAVGAASIVIWVWFSRNYLRGIDEIDLQDNLWASLVALYFFVAAAPFWLLLHEVALAPAPQLMALWWATLAVAVLAYFYRKYR